ncbi:MAG: hypothetical protein IKL56_06305 [Bacteroidaceae bacterium]|nr:hypothetical protein [Bacteroidaceae bacterium]
MGNTDNSPEEEKAIKKKKEDDSNVILNMLVVNKKAKFKACASELNIKFTLMFYSERSQGSPQAVRLCRFQKHQTYTGLNLHQAYCRCGRYCYTCLCI